MNKKIFQNATRVCLAKSMSMPENNVPCKICFMKFRNYSLKCIFEKETIKILFAFVISGFF